MPKPWKTALEHWVSSAPAGEAQARQQLARVLHGHNAADGPILTLGPYVGGGHIGAYAIPCSVLTSLPPLLPEKVTQLNLRGFSQLTVLPPSMLTHLTQLSVSDSTGLTQLPAPLPSGLIELTVTGSPGLKALPPLGAALRKLTLDGVGFDRLPALPDTLEELTLSNMPTLSELKLPSGLKTLKLSNCTGLTRLSGTVDRLESMRIKDSPNLQTLPALPGRLHSLELKNIAGPEKWKRWPWHLSELKLDGLTRLTEVGGLSALRFALREGLVIRNCPALRSISGLASMNLMANSQVDLSGNTSLVELSGIPRAATHLNLMGNRSLTTLPTNAPYDRRGSSINLQVLNLEGCESLPAELPVWAANVTGLIADVHYEFDTDFISNWYKRAQKTLPAQSDWPAIRNEPGFERLRPLIDRLAQLRSREWNVLARPVVELLEAIQQASPASRLHIYNAASGASADCHARPLELLTRTLIEARASELTRTQAPTAAFIELARGSLGLEWLREITAELATFQWQNGRAAPNASNTGPNLSQEMHLELSLRGVLAAELGLPFVARDPYPGMAGLTSQDVTFARGLLQQRINGDLSTPLMVQPLLKRHMETRFGANPEFKRLQESFAERMLSLSDASQMDALVVERDLAVEKWLEHKLGVELNRYYEQWAGRLREWIGTESSDGLLKGVQGLRVRIAAYGNDGLNLAVGQLRSLEADLRSALQLPAAQQARMAWKIAANGMDRLTQVKSFLTPWGGLGVRLHQDNYAALNHTLDGLLKMKLAAPDLGKSFPSWQLPEADPNRVRALLDFRAGEDSGDVAPHAIAAAIQRPLLIRVLAADGREWVTGIRTDINGVRFSGETIKLTLRQTQDGAGNHYDYVDAAGQPAQVPGDGLCLFHAVLAAAPELRASLGADLSPQAAVEALYGMAYAHLDQNLARYGDFATNPVERLLPWRDYRDRYAPGFSRLAGQAGATLRHAPQAIWLDTDTRSRRAGLCAGLASAWAQSPQAGDTLLDNLFVAAAHPHDQAAKTFRADIAALQRPGAALAGIDSWEGALAYLGAQGGTRALLVVTGNHMLALAAQGEGAQRRYSLFEPNAGQWTGMTRQAVQQALDAYFTPELRTHYGFYGRLRAFEPPAAVQGSPQAQAANRARSALRLSGDPSLPAGPTQDAPDLNTPQRQASLLDGAHPGRAVAPDAKLRLASRAQRTLLVSGTGLRLFGAYRNLISLRDNLRAGQATEAGIDAGSVLGEGAGEALERSLPWMAPRLAQALSKIMPRAIAPALQTMARGLARGAGVIGNLLTLPFDLYSAIVNFSRAGRLEGLERQDALVTGSFATTGMVSGLALAGAAAAGAGASSVGPAGLAIGLGLLVGMQIYAGVRQVQEIERTLTLSPEERFKEGLRGFLGLGESHATQLARVAEHCRQQMPPQAEADMRRLLESQPAIGAVLSAVPRARARELAGVDAGSHTHRHLVTRAEFPRPDPAKGQQQLDALTNSVSWGGGIDGEGFSLTTAQAVLNGGNALASSPGAYEVYVEDTDDTVDASSGVNGPASGAFSLFRRKVVALGSASPVTGSERDDLLSVQLPTKAPARHALIDGGAGENTLQLRLNLPGASRYAGFSVDLATGVLALRQEAGGSDPLAQVRNIDHLMVMRAAGDSSGAHHVRGDERANRLSGGGNDLLLGEDGDDLLWLSDRAHGDGGSGEDLIRMAGNTDADGGAGGELYLIEPMQAGERRLIADLGPELNTVYLAMPAAQLSTLCLKAGGQLELLFGNGAILVLDENYAPATDGGALRAARYQVLSQDGQALSLDLPSRAVDQTLVVRWLGAEDQLAAILPRLGPLQAMRAALAEPALLFNFANGNDTLTGAAAQANRFVLGSGNKSVTGGARDDVLHLDATPASDSPDVAEQGAVLRAQQSRLGEWRYQFDGGAGSDTLVLATRFAGSDHQGYRVDLQSGEIAALARDGRAPTSLGRLQGIENLLVAPGEAEGDSVHQLYGNAQANLLSGRGRDRLYGREGDDLLRLAGQAQGDGGAGRDRFQIAALGANDQVTVQDDAGEVSEVELQFKLEALRTVRLGGNGRDLVLEHVSGGSVTLRDALPAPGAEARFAISTEDGWRVTPQWSDSARAQAALSLQLHHPLSGAGLVLGTEQADRLQGQAGFLLRGGNGADRYRIELDGDGPPVFINNRADDGALDTLELNSAMSAHDFRLRRLGDDLALLRTPTTQSGSGELRALVLDYFNDARPHLALEIGGRSLRADEVSALALEAEADDALPETPLASGGYERLIQAMAQFAPQPGAVESVHVHDGLKASSGWLAAA